MSVIKIDKYLNSFFKLKLQEADKELYNSIRDEFTRQQNHIELIASENIVSRAVLEAQGSVLTNKYAEGYIGKRFYGGCEFVDQVEQLAIDRIKKLYGAEYANVQPHSGSQANQAIYFAFLKPGDTIMGMNLGHGGHLTHGSPANLSGKLFNIIPYGLNDKEEIDYDHMEELAIENKPKLIIGGASAYAFFLNINHQLAASKKLDIKNAIAIASHPQALGQCNKWIDRNIGSIKRLEMSSSAEAAKYAKQNSNILCIVNSLAVSKYKLKVIKKNIQDYSENKTRFLVIGREKVSKTGNDKTSMLIMPQTKQG